VLREVAEKTPSEKKPASEPADEVKVKNQTEDKKENENPNSDIDVTA